MDVVNIILQVKIQGVLRELGSRLEVRLNHSTSKMMNVEIFRGCWKLSEHLFDLNEAGTYSRAHWSIHNFVKPLEMTQHGYICIRAYHFFEFVGLEAPFIVLVGSMSDHSFMLDTMQTRCAQSRGKRVQ